MAALQSAAMPAYANKTEVFNAAILRIGASKIASENDNRSEVTILQGIYTGVVSDWTSKHAWSFMKQSADVTKAGETGKKPAYYYFLPSDCDTFSYAEIAGAPVSDIKLVGSQLWTDHDATLTVYYNAEPDPQLWPGDFAEGIVKYLHAALLRGLVMDEAAADSMEGRAKVKMIEAMTRDRRQSGGIVATKEPKYVQAWRSGRRASS